MSRLHNLYKLKNLYLQRDLQDSYFEESILESKSLSKNTDLDYLLHRVQSCSLCNKSIQIPPSLGILPKSGFSDIIFLLDSLEFEDKKKQSSISNLQKSRVNDMLLKIISNVFLKDPSQVYILPLVKCYSIQVEEQTISSCKSHLLGELDYIINKDKNIKYIVAFGENISSTIFNISLKDGLDKIIKYLDIKCILTYSLFDLMLNPTYKVSSMRHFKLLKGLM